MDTKGLLPLDYSKSKYAVVIVNEASTMAPMTPGMEELDGLGEAPITRMTGTASVVTFVPSFILSIAENSLLVIIKISSIQT